MNTTSTGAPGGRGRTLLGLVIAGTALVVIDMTIVTIGLPEIQRDLGGTLADVQWVIISYLITMGAVTQVAGSLSDRVGRRRMYLVGLLVFTVASVACGAAPNALLLDLARAVQGIGGAVLMVNALPLLSHRFDGERRTMAISTWGSVATAASVIAPLLGGLLVDILSWRAIFLINVPIGVVAFVVALRILPADAPTRSGRVDWAGTVLLVGALGLVNFALLQGEQQGWLSAATLIQVGLGVAAFVVFLRVETTAATPVLDITLFHRPAFTGAALAIFMSRVLSIGGTVFFVLYLQDSLLLTPTQTGLLLTPVFVAQIAAGMIGGKLLSRFPAGRVIAAGYLLKSAGAGWLALAFAPGLEPWVLVVPLLLWGTGGGIAGAPVMAVAMNVTDKRRAGMVAGTITSLASIGAGIGTATLGIVYQGRVDDVLGTGGSVGDAIAAGASAVSFGSAGLAALTVVAVLILISRRNLAASNPATAHERG